MRRTLPSTTALEAFEAAARHQSFTKAAEALSVTQSAICRQVAGLEAYLQVALFRRTRRGVVLTEAGADYARRVSERLDDVERDTLDLMSRGGQGSAIELAVVPTFGTQWLLPRLPAYLAGQPHVQVHLSARTRPFLFAETTFDAAIHAGLAGGAAWPGTEIHFLMHEELIAVASPALLARLGVCASADGMALDAADWARLPLLQPSTRPHAWREYFGRIGLEVPHAMAGPRMELFSMLTQAAVQGLGLALAPPFLLQSELARGTLVALGPGAVPSGRAYSMIYPESKAERPALRALKDWLQQECSATATATATANTRASGAAPEPPPGAP